MGAAVREPKHDHLCRGLTSCSKNDLGTPKAQLELTGELSAAEGRET
jgi:hypothetical protein